MRLALVLLACLISCGPYYPKKLKHLMRAEHLTSEGDFKEAIREYEKHIDLRSNQEHPDWENPYFYLLIIGDLKLKLKKPKEALKNYLKADSQKVSSILVNDRIRLVASWYESNSKIKEAIKLLEKYRKRDTLMFDLMLDRFSKKLVKTQDQKN